MPRQIAAPQTEQQQPSTAASKEEEAQLKRWKVELYDATALKHKLDETASEVILQSGYEADCLNSNVKIVLGLIGVAVAVYSHFGPGKFPANWWTVAFCVATYVVINVVLVIFSSIKEGDSFLVTHPKPGSEYGVRVASRMERFSDTYSLIISSANKWEDREVMMQASVAAYFHSDGYLAHHKFTKDVAKLLKQYELLDASSAPRPKALTPGKQD